MRIDIVTLFPGMFGPILESSILGRAARPVANPADPGDLRGPVVSYHLHDPRAYTTDKHSKVDQPPYGGGPGMVLQCQPIYDCVRAAEAQLPDVPAKRVVMTPKGMPLTQPLAESLAQAPRLIVIAGHYEGFDQRLLDELEPVEISLGDYVLTGGELPAMVLIDSIVRLLPGALGDTGSAHHDSFSPGSENDTGQRLLDHPHYTRPPEWHRRPVPPTLLSGNHAKIAAWRREQALALTQDRRPDLLLRKPGGPTPTPASSTGPTASRPQAVVLRDFSAEDAPAVHALLLAAFPTDAEARLVAALRDAGDLPIELVAEIDGQVVGHIGFSPVTVVPQPGDDGQPGFSNPRFRALALAPLTVDPAHQRQGIGKALARLGLRHCRDASLAAAFVIGDPAYYHPLGFEPAGPLGYTNPFHTGEAFQACVLKETQRPLGRLEYAPAFALLEG